MAYAFVEDVAASWERYEQGTAVALRPVPEVLMLHLAGATAEGFRVIEVWADQAAWLRFRDNRLAPILASTIRPSIPEPTFRDVQVVHLPGRRRVRQRPPLSPAGVPPSAWLRYWVNSVRGARLRRPGAVVDIPPGVGCDLEC
jgi:hypothetical protein